MSESKGVILVVDDDREMRALLSDLLEEEGYHCELANSAEAAMTLIEVKHYDLLISDLRMCGLSGLDLLKQARLQRADQAMMIITAFGTVATAIEAMKQGAYDYLIKPFKREHFLLVVKKAFERIYLQQELLRLRQVVSRQYQFSNIIGKSKLMQDIFHLIGRVSESIVNISVSGESGTGKELVAKAIHYNSPRKNQPFVAIDCASIPEMLLESELFGHVRGAFTDAKSDKKGLVEVAHGGTLFLDEIGEMPLSLQPKLLRMIQEKRLRRVGATHTIPVNIRIISASNRDLLEAVKMKQFRDDLYYRLNVLQITLPPLRKRRDDIPLLAGHFLKKYATEQHKKLTGFSESALNILINYEWPGNVRELENAIERAVTLALARKKTIGAEDFPPSMTGGREDQVLLDDNLDKLASLETMQQEYVVRILQAAGGNKAKAAQILQIDRKTLYRKLHDYQKRLEK